MSVQRILLWYRHHLRLHDHEPLHQAQQQNAQIIPLYCFDPRQFSRTSYGFPKTGSFRSQFLLESIANLRYSLQSIGSNLLIRHGKPEDIIPQLCQDLAIDAVYCYQEVTAEETYVEQQIENQLHPLHLSLTRFWGSTLSHRDDLPFPPEDTPEVFTQFRKKLEQNFTIRSPFPTPDTLPPLPEVDLGTIPTLADLDVEPVNPDDRGVLPFQGGERAGMQRVEDYFWTQDRLQQYKKTRNGMLGPDYSSKFSPWLALGCLSPRFIYTQVQQYEQERVQNQSTYWLIFELLWRDYFRYICVKHGNALFYSSGLQGIELPWKEDWKRFDLWREGKTGYPLVDANMREIAATGFMSNRGRQNVASFLTKNLGIHWLMGAEWFESLLIDYDVCSNYGNWNYVAGVGNDARGFRYFNIPKQSKDYDPQGKYIKHWLPELEPLPPHLIHEPWKLSQGEQKQYGVQLGVDYPRPVVDFFKSVKTNEKVYKEAVSN
ncbi:DASH family cryptochrome [Spirulina sp. CS-785/01]|uniref:DASH family cryptochrome n=1 Tax=Spirulina sp. CS-785/01 TaxID=3021716 RepID=UPI00232D7C3B|nr:DASH family cryptochrome [Spirulina sp. CS-785/01]MDB9313322.1 DASH family cryptochrome [Spirulina sp. CS-785/01]